MIKFKGKVVYWADPPIISENIEEEYNDCFKHVHEDLGLFIPKIIFVEFAPLKGHGEEKYYDLLMFDWGGMSIGNSMLEHYCKYILKEAVDCPSRYYVMVSTMTKYAMEDALHEMGDNKPQNVFLDFKSLAKWLEKYGQ